MDIGKAFTYVFEDPKWIMKVLIGGVLVLVPIFGWMAILGYYLTTMKNVADGQPTPMPEWGDFGTLFMKGLYGFVGVLIYYAPVLILACCAAILQGVGTGLLSSGGKNGSDTIATAVTFLAICIQCLQALIGFVTGITFFAPLMRFAMSNNQLSVFWDVRGSFDFIKQNIGNYVIALLLGWVASLVAFFGVILCVIGVIFTLFWANMVTANLWGQVWRASSNKGMSAAPTMA